MDLKELLNIDNQTDKRAKNKVGKEKDRIPETEL